jgi:hypothetical protein
VIATTVVRVCQVRVCAPCSSSCSTLWNEHSSSARLAYGRDLLEAAHPESKHRSVKFRMNWQKCECLVDFLRAARLCQYRCLPLAQILHRLRPPDDHVLGHILSFLPAMEVARASLLSSWWCGVYDHVHTVSMEEELDQGATDYNGNALLTGTHRDALPLRALRLAVEEYQAGDCSAIDHRFNELPFCERPYYCCPGGQLTVGIDQKQTSALHCSISLAKDDS